MDSLSCPKTVLGATEGRNHNIYELFGYAYCPGCEYHYPLVQARKEFELESLKANMASATAIINWLRNSLLTDSQLDVIVPRFFETQAFDRLFPHGKPMSLRFMKL